MPIRSQSRRSPTTRRRRQTSWTRSDSTTDLMSDARSAGWSPLQRWPARLHWRWQASAIGSVAVAAAALAIAPLLSLVVLAFGDTGDLWVHLARYVIPPALVQTALLLAGVAALTIVVGTGTAWTVTTFTFPGRDALTWLLPLPLAIPTYIVAYVYVDLLDALGPVQSTLRAIFGWRSAADYRFPNIRSLGGAILLFSLVLYPYVYLAARAMFQTQGRLFSEAARTHVGRAAMGACAAHNLSAGATRDCPLV